MDIGVKLEPLIKIFVTFSFLMKMAAIFCGVKVDAKAAGNNLLGSLDTLEVLENGLKLKKCGF